MHISIPDLFACMNNKTAFHDWNAAYYYTNVHTVHGGKASACIQCGKCEAVCPQHLPIRELLKQTGAALNAGVTPVEIKEIVYQAVAYLGMGWVSPFLRSVNEVQAGQGGCEPQLTSHAGGNMKIGNDKAFLIKVISQCIPCIGDPRSLNALRCVNGAWQKLQEGN